MASKGYTAVKGRRVRVTRVDACGRPIYGESSQAVSKGVISAAWTANTIETDEVNQTNFGGERCVYEASEPELTGYTLEIQFCEVDPELFSLITGQKIYYDANGNAIGFSINTKISLSDRAFALEIWAGAPAGDACATPGAQGTYGYFLAPFVKGGYIGDYTIENGAVTFTITGATTRDGNQWLSGPYKVMMGLGTPEVQRVTITGTPTGGTFTLTFGGQTTGPIAYNATAATVQAALEALSNVDPGDIVATGGPLPGTAVTLTFGGRLVGDQAQLTATGSLTGGTTPAVTVTTITPGVAVQSALTTPLDKYDHKLLIWVTVAPPELFYGTRPLLDPTAPALTGMTFSKTGQTATITFTGATTAPVWVDFGDGTWDYIEAGTTGASHVYAGAGPYTVKASSNGTWVQNVVAFP